MCPFDWAEGWIAGKKLFLGVSEGYLQKRLAGGFCAVLGDLDRAERQENGAPPCLSQDISPSMLLILGPWVQAGITPPASLGVQLAGGQSGTFWPPKVSKRIPVTAVLLHSSVQ